MDYHYHQDFAQFKPDINAPAYQDNHYNQGFAHYNADANVPAYQPHGIYGGHENVPVYNGFPDAPAHQPHGIYGQQEHLPAYNGFPVAQNQPHGTYGGQENVYSQNVLATNFPPKVPSYQNGIPEGNGNYQLGVYEHEQDQFGNGNQENVPAPNLVQQEVHLPHALTKRGKMCDYGDFSHISEYENTIRNRYRVFNIKNSVLPPGAPLNILPINCEQWGKFHKETNEMMLVNQGRNLFPQLGFYFDGMHPNSEYVLGVKLHLQSEQTFKGSWSAVETPPNAAMVSNEVFSVPKTGSELMKEGFMFNDLKIYNIGKDSKKGKNSKESMSEEQLTQEMKAEEKRRRSMLLVVPQHMYIPVLSVYEVSECGEMNVVQAVCFAETSFIVVTKYKNAVIRNMKTSENKFTPMKTKSKPARQKNRILKQIEVVPQPARPVLQNAISTNQQELFDEAQRALLD